MNLEKPLVSVIVPVYYAGEYLIPCLESIRDQTLKDLEVILVDNGSTQQDSELCDQWAHDDPRFRVIHHENKGIIGGRGSGFSLARGEYISFMDSDDFIHPEMLQTLLDSCQKNHVPCACCQFRPFNGGNVPIDKPLQHPAETHFQTPDHLDALMHDARVGWSLCNKLYHRSLLEGLSFQSRIIYNEDLYLNWLIFQKASGIAYVDFVGYHYRQHGTSTSHRTPDDKLFQDQIEVAEMIRRDCKGGPLEDSAWAFYYEKMLYLDSMILRRQDSAMFERRHNELLIRLRTEFQRALHCPKLAIAFKIVAVFNCRLTALYRLVCRTLLTDRR